MKKLKKLLNMILILVKVLVEVSRNALASRNDILMDLIKKSDSYNDGLKNYVLLSLNKKKYESAIKKRLESSSIEQILGSIEGHPKKENFLKLSKAINIISGSLDVIFK